MDLHAFAQQLVDRRTLCTGVQICRAIDGTEEDVVISDPRAAVAITGDTVFSVVCATKPVLALAVLLLHDQGLLDLSEPVADVLGETSVFARLAVDTWSVLDHTAGLGAPNLLQVAVTPERSRAALLRKGLADAVDQYSDYTAAVLLVALIERVTRAPAIDLVEGQMLAALDLDDHLRFRFTPDELVSWRHRIGVYVTGLPDRSVPLLHDRSPHQACQDRLVLGGYASARGLCRLYAALGSVFAGDQVPGLPRPELLHRALAARGERRYEKTFARECRFAGGFMIQLDEHGFGDSPAPEAFGHSGYLGRSFGFYDPRSGTAGSVVLNGLDERTDEIAPLRAEIVSAILDR